MIVCLCNGLNDRKIEAAVRAGASTLADIFRHHGLRPNCGQCCCQLRDRLAALRPQGATAHPASAV